jgi:hypothetical protein
MKATIFLALLLTAASIVGAQQLPQGAANSQVGGQADSSRLTTVKKRLTDGIDIRIGKLEELERMHPVSARYEGYQRL